MTLSRRAALVRTAVAGIVGGLFPNIRSAFAATAHYLYDERGRLVTVAYSDGTRTDYTYDDAGNRTRVVSSYVSAYTDGTIVFDSSEPGTWQWICARTQNYEVRIWGPGAGGSGSLMVGDEKSGFYFYGGAGGGGGGYSARQFTIEFGDVLGGRVGAGGVGGDGSYDPDLTRGHDGSEATSLASYQGAALTANPGGGFSTYTGGSASGGTTNTAGRAAGLTSAGDGGGGGNGGGDQTTYSGNGTVPGGGGAGEPDSPYSGGPGGNGAHGRVQIIAR